jgi:superfamily I DNA and/or RNA helicase
MNRAKMISNMKIMYMMMTYGNLTQESRQYSHHIWNSFALIVPVVSTTFSSFAFLFKDLDAQKIGYLLIDEAGQVSPHRAIGAIWRAKKVVIIGDPLQIEPVETLPLEIAAEIIKERGLPQIYNPIGSSAQYFADQSNNIGTYINTSTGQTWIGSPLLVHRRCQNPMFKVANHISYDNMMIYNTQNASSSLQNIFPKSLWLDIESSQISGRIVLQEIKVVLAIINKIIKIEKKLPSLFVITPFADIDKGIKKILSEQMILPLTINKRVQEKWIKKSVGTFHKFQGKEAEMVIIVLGCNESFMVSVNWANKANLLSVALTRAKNTVLIIANASLWSTKSYFAALYQNIESIDYEKFHKNYLK